MKRRSRQSGFSLMETLLAVGALAIGMVFVAGTFLAGVYFATLSTERTIGAVVADEAFAKIRLYGLDPNNASLKTDGYVPYESLVAMPAEEHRYPSTNTAIEQQYGWAAICRRRAADSRLVEFTVFVCRQAGSATQYWTRQLDPDWPTLAQVDAPRPLEVNIVQATAPVVDGEVAIVDAVAGDTVDEHAFVSDGALLVDDATGQIYRVLERYANSPERLRLDRPWAGADLTAGGGAWVWVVPPPTQGGRDPFVAVYQKVLSF
jgi:Tfp pilus assembly protein PilV